MDITNAYDISNDTRVHTNSPIIVNSSNSVWTFVRYVSILRGLISFYDYPVPYVVLIRDLFSIFSFVVIDFDQSLLAFLDVSPVSIMSYIEKGIKTKH